MPFGITRIQQLLMIFETSFHVRKTSPGPPWKIFVILPRLSKGSFGFLRVPGRIPFTSIIGVAFRGTEGWKSLNPRHPKLAIRPMPFWDGTIVITIVMDFHNRHVIQIRDTHRGYHFCHFAKLLGKGFFGFGFQTVPPT